MVESSVYRNGQCHPERYRSTQRYNTVRPSLPILKKCRWFGYTLESFVLIFKKKKTVIKGSGFAWREARTVQGNPNPVFGIMEFFMAVFGILGFGIGNPKRRIQNPGLSCIPLKGATEKAMLSPQISRNWNSLMTLYLYLVSVISNDSGFRGDVNKQGHLTTVFSQMSVRRTKNCLEISIAWWRLNISRWPFHSLIHGTFFEACLINNNFLHFTEQVKLFFLEKGKLYFRIRKCNIERNQKNSYFRKTLNCF